MADAKSRKKSGAIKGVTIRFTKAELDDIRKAADIDRRSMNSFIVRACAKAAVETMRAALQSETVAQAGR